MRTRKLIRKMKGSHFLCAILGMSVFLTFPLLGTPEAQTGDVITTITTRESGNYVPIMDIAVGPKDVLYVARFCWVEGIAPDGSRWVVPPTGEPGHELYSPTGLAVDGEGNLYVSESGSQRGKPVVQERLGQCTLGGDRGALRKITPAGEDILLAGELSNSVLLSNSYLIGVDGEGRPYFWYGGQLWRLDATGERVVVGGRGFGDPKDPAFGDVDGKRATEVALWSYKGGNGWVDANGDIYLAQRLYVFRIDGQTGVISRVAGNGRQEHSGDGGPALEAGFISAEDVVKDRQGNLYVGDAGSLGDGGSFRVRRIDGQTGIITTVAGTGEKGYTGDGGDPLQAKIIPNNLAVDSQGDLYVADSERVRKIDFAPRSTAVVGGWGEAGMTAPLRLRLDGEPNPANREMVVSYALPAETQVRLEVVDLLGRQVRTLVQGYQEAGSHRVVWDGLDGQGREMGSGVYVLRLQTGNQGIATRKVLMLK